MTNPVSFHDRSLETLHHAMRAALMRQRAIQANLASANVPGYKRLEVKFESILAEKAGDAPIEAESILSTIPELTRDNSPGRTDGNNVELDRELAANERNRLQFEALLEIASLEIQGIREAIRSR